MSVKEEKISMSMEGKGTHLTIITAGIYFLMIVFLYQETPCKIISLPYVHK